jgi:peptidyl-dipeptidase Dcp
MKKLTLFIMSGLLLVGCAKNDNPFFTTYKNKYGAPPFDKIKSEHYMPAFKEGIKQQQAEIDAIAERWCTVLVFVSCEKRVIVLRASHKE